MAWCTRKFGTVLLAPRGARSSLTHDSPSSPAAGARCFVLASCHWELRSLDTEALIAICRLEASAWLQCKARSPALSKMYSARFQQLRNVPRSSDPCATVHLTLVYRPPFVLLLARCAVFTGKAPPHQYHKHIKSLVSPRVGRPRVHHSQEGGIGRTCGADLATSKHPSVWTIHSRLTRRYEW